MIKYFLLILFLLPTTAFAGMAGYIAVEGRGYTQHPLYEFDAQGKKLQEPHDGAFIFAPEYYKEFSDGSQFVFSPYYMEDTGHDERDHADIRELYYHKVWDTVELSIGAKKIFWGVTESQHVVDIINQTDTLSSFDTEDKLGQPMVHLSKTISLDKNLGTLDFYLMPYFRQRDFPGTDGRLRDATIINTDEPIYESDKEEEHVDYAVRYSNYIGAVDFSISHFDGTSRDAGITLSGADFVPYYPQINQTGATLQIMLGEWIWKAEGMHRNGRNMSYEVATAGFEYTFTGIFGSKADLGTLIEYHYDSRGKTMPAPTWYPTPEMTTPNPFEDDLMGGFRLALNDLGSTEILSGIVVSLKDSHEKDPAKMYFIEASRRLNDNLRFSLEARFFQDQPKDDILYFLRKDDHFLAELAYYF